VKEKHSGLLYKSGGVLIAFLILIPLLLVGCECDFNCSKEQAQSTIRVNSVTTASNVSMTDGVWDWWQYVEQDSFPSGYEGPLWVMFNFSNALHNGSVNIRANVYILSNGAIKAEDTKDASITNSSDNTMWWGDLFDISTYADGDYSVIVTITDLIAGTAAANWTNFEISAAP